MDENSSRLLKMTGSSRDVCHLEDKQKKSSRHRRLKPEACDSVYSSSKMSFSSSHCSSISRLQEVNNEPKFSANISLVVPRNKKEEMCTILSPLYKHVNGLGSVVKVVDHHKSHHPSARCGRQTPHYSVSTCEMNAPSLAIVLFLPELGRHCYEKVRRKFQKPPWRHHHTIQLENSVSNSVIGKQEFYFLSRKLPLWCTCPSIHTHTKVRFTIFVRRYNAMVEFYRLLTGTEMETTKQGFCLFPLNVEPSLAKESIGNDSETYCELALKHCPNINPYSISDAYLTLPVNNISTLRTILPSKVTSISKQHFIVHDPDGNTVVLFDVTSCHTSTEIRNTLYLKSSRQCIADVPEKTSLHSDGHDSHDSGLFSDFDSYTTELDQCMSRLGFDSEKFT